MTRAVHSYLVHCGGLEFIAEATSGAQAMIDALDLHGVPATSAKRLP